MGDRLPDLGFQVTQLATYGRFHLQVLQTFADKGETSFHIADVLVQALQLAAAEEVVLLDTLVYHIQLVAGGIVVFFRLQIIFTSQQLFVIKAFVLPVAAFLLNQFFAEADPILLQAKMFLFHAQAGIAEFVFLIRQVGFALQDTDIQERVAQAQDHVTGFYLCPFLNQTFFHTPSFDGIQIDDTVGNNLPDHADIVVELPLGDGRNSQPLLIHLHGRGRVAKDKIEDADDQEATARYRINMFLLQTGFPFDPGIHVVVHSILSCLFYS